LRVVCAAYEREYGHLEKSGLSKELQERGLQISHRESDFDAARLPNAIAVLEPEKVPFVSYPYEWCFSQLKDAALCTLEIQMRALDKGMCLKDASAFNIQFLRGKPILIDSLSFEVYEEGAPWRAYRQFCEHFLAPLALIASRDARLGKLSQIFLDGVPLDLAAKLSPMRTRLKPGLSIHLHLHARAQAQHSDSSRDPRSARVSSAGMRGLIESLESTVRGIRWRPGRTPWVNYESESNYSQRAAAEKRRIVAEMLDAIRPAPGMVWDLGANIGVYSRIAAERGANVVAWDLDPGAVERHYLDVKAREEAQVLPLVQDLTNPSPGIGWENLERDSFGDRSDADALLALALIHHLAIGNNVPLGRIAEVFERLAPWLIVEFIPKSDSQTKRLLRTRNDSFGDYSMESFEEAFLEVFTLVTKVPIAESERTLYLMRRRNGQ